MSKHKSVEIRVPVETNNPALRRIESKCISCGKCRDVCKQMISVGNHFDLNKTLDTAICIHCGQCINVCPSDALVEVKEWMPVVEAIHDPQSIVVAMTSPSVRVALGEEFSSNSGAYVEEQMVGALRDLGFDYVFDTTFAADLTIMEEASELIDRITNQKPLPQFTSCCPAWVKFVETYYPKLLPNISTSKSPISMFGPTIKTYFANKEHIDPKRIVTVAITPCTAKKFEIRREEMKDAGEYHNLDIRDTDFVVTVRELAQWMKSDNRDLDSVTPSSYDSLMPRGSGAGIIFGNTGGVMEAALRTAHYMLTGKNPDASFLHLEALRGMDGIKTATVTINDLEIKAAVIHGTDHVRRFLNEYDMKDFHFIEVMTCRGGCIGGGGQPKHIGEDMDDVRKKRIASLYQKDDEVTLRFSHDNEMIKKVYDEFYGAPLSELAEKLLHTSYQDRSSDLGEDPQVYASMYEKEENKTTVKTTASEQWKCMICGYIYEGDLTLEGDDFKCPICFVDKSMFEKMSEENKETTVETNPSLQYKCSVCGYIYEGDITKEGPDYVCPVCNVPVDFFNKL